jgi:hypothetical protein
MLGWRNLSLGASKYLLKNSGLVPSERGAILNKGREGYKE